MSPFLQMLLRCAWDNFTVSSTNVLGLFRPNDLHLENKWICSNCTVITLVLGLTGICQRTKSEIFLTYEYLLNLPKNPCFTE